MKFFKIFCHGWQKSHYHLHMNQMQFAIYSAGDAYSTSNKIMGRQSAGKSFIKGIAKSYFNQPIAALGPSQASGHSLLAQLQADGFQSQLKWSTLPNLTMAKAVGTLYYPAPPLKELAYTRNLENPAAFSIMGVTHTPSSAGAMDQISDLILPPFQPWDALICTSTAAQTMVRQLQSEVEDYWREHTGATKFVKPQTPVIPLGVNAADFASTPEQKLNARHFFQIADNCVVFLFSGRLSFHAKANPIAMYQALEKTAKNHKVVCIEAGLFPNEPVQKAYQDAQRAIAPNVQFIWANGQDSNAFQNAWRAADVFISLADNIQETFGLTPIEAQAAGLPVVVSDWNGYKDTVNHGVDGFKIPTLAPPPGAGKDLALKHALGIDTYDYFIGRTSLATAVEHGPLEQALNDLASKPDLRQQMGAQGRSKVLAKYDWSVVLQQYNQLANELNELRTSQIKASPAKAQTWPQRVDPFERFELFSTRRLHEEMRLIVPNHLTSQAFEQKLQGLLGLTMTVYPFNKDPGQVELLKKLGAILIQHCQESQTTTLLEIQAKLHQAGLVIGNAQLKACICWFIKFDLIEAIEA